MSENLEHAMQILRDGYNMHNCNEWKRGLLWFIEDTLLKWNPDLVDATVIMEFVKKKHAELDSLGVPYKKDSEYEPFSRCPADREGQTYWPDVN